MKLIDADALIADLDKGLWGKDYDKALAEAIIQDAPSIDIVRCGECKRAEHEPSGVRCGISDVLMGEDGFCSIGKRKVNDGR